MPASVPDTSPPQPPPSTGRHRAPIPQPAATPNNGRRWATALSSAFLVSGAAIGGLNLWHDHHSAPPPSTLPVAVVVAALDIPPTPAPATPQRVLCVAGTRAPAGFRCVPTLTAADVTAAARR